MGPEPHRPVARRTPRRARLFGLPIVKIRPTLARLSLEFAFDSFDRSWQLASPFGRPELFGVQGVAKPEWGSKRICLNCGARFYDMNRDPIVCPACSTVLDPVAQNRPRRSRAAPKLAAVAAVVEPDDVVVAEPDEEVEADDDEEEEVVVVAATKDDEEDDEDETEDDGESAIEDVSELGDDDMADVIETDLDEDEQER
jgi:uncharacterized protein (TIGR02300 family)